MACLLLVCIACLHGLKSLYLWRTHEQSKGARPQISYDIWSKLLKLATGLDITTQNLKSVTPTTRLRLPGQERFWLGKIFSSTYNGKEFSHIFLDHYYLLNSRYDTLFSWLSSSQAMSVTSFSHSSIFPTILSIWVSVLFTCEITRQLLQTHWTYSLESWEEEIKRRKSILNLLANQP